MAQPILLRGAKQVLTLRGPSGVRRGSALHDLGIIEDGSVLIRDGVIASIGTTRRLENLKQARDAIEVPVTGRILMPAFVDAALNVTFENVNASAARTHKQKIASLCSGTLALLRSCLQHGTLTAEMKAEALDSCLLSGILGLRQLAKIANPIRIVPTWRISHSLLQNDGDLSNFRETLAVIARRKLVEFVEIAPNSVDDNAGSSLERMFALAQEAKLGIKLLWPGGSTELLSRLLARFNPRTVSVPSHLTDAECMLLTDTRTISVFAPAPEAFECPAGACIKLAAESGAAIALSTEYDSRHSGTSSMQMAICIAVMRLGLSIEQAIVAATINAAHALGCGNIVGSIEFGKRADILVLSVPDYREIPRHFGVNHVDIAIRNGAVVFNRTRWKASNS